MSQLAFMLVPLGDDLVRARIEYTWTPEIGQLSPVLLSVEDQATNEDILYRLDQQTKSWIKLELAAGVGLAGDD